MPPAVSFQSTSRLSDGPRPIDPPDAVTPDAGTSPSVFAAALAALELMDATDRQDGPPIPAPEPDPVLELALASLAHVAPDQAFSFLGVCDGAPSQAPLA